MNSIFHYKRFYGTEITVRFTLETPAGGGLVTSAATIFDAGDFKISKDGGALTNTTNLPTQITAGQPLYSLVLTDVEMAASEVIVTGRDVATGSYQPVTIVITTRETFSQLYITSSPIGGDTPAVVITGIGTSAGIQIQGGIGGGPGISSQGFSDGPGIKAFNDESGDGLYARGGTLGGNGINAIGQGNLNGMTIQAGATNGNALYLLGNGTNPTVKIENTSTGNGVNVTIAGASATRSNFFDDIYTDITAAPVAGVTTIKQAIGLLIARFFNKVTQSATTQSICNTVGTVKATAPMTDDGITQTKGKFV